jgi:hypothetical protein
MDYSGIDGDDEDMTWTETQRHAGDIGADGLPLSALDVRMQRIDERLRRVEFMLAAHVARHDAQDGDL